MLRQRVDEFDSVVVLATDFVDEEVQQRQARLVGTSVDQLRQRRHPKPRRVAGVAALHDKRRIQSINQ